MACNKNIGIHLRINNNLTKLAQDTLGLNLKNFQFFLIKQKEKKYLQLLQDDIDNFLKIKRNNFSNLYIHCSYWINLSSQDHNIHEISKRILQKEIAFAKKLEIKNLVLHPGCANGNTGSKINSKKTVGINILAKTLNSILKKEQNIEILLENIAHGNNNIGNDLQDFVEIKSKLNKPEKINFCLDLSHAFAYGYNLNKTEEFIKIINKTMGLNKIKLIHLNDSAKPMGSKIDQHEIPGKGFIGKKLLKHIINLEIFKHIPIIIEPPKLEHKDLKKLVKDWIK